MKILNSEEACKHIIKSAFPQLIEADKAFREGIESLFEGFVKGFEEATDCKIDSFSYDSMRGDDTSHCRVRYQTLDKEGNPRYVTLS